MSDRPGRDERRDGEPPASGAGTDGDETARQGRRDPSDTDREPANAPDEDDEEWEISLSDLREREETDELAQLREADPEPGVVSAESAAFVMLGVVVCVLLLYVGFL